MRIFLIVEMILKIMQKSGKTRPKLTVRDEDDLLFSLWIFLFFLQGLGQVRRRLRPVQPHVRGGHAAVQQPRPRGVQETPRREPERRRPTTGAPNLTSPNLT